MGNYESTIDLFRDKGNIVLPQCFGNKDHFTPFKNDTVLPSAQELLLSLNFQQWNSQLLFTLRRNIMTQDFHTFHQFVPKCVLLEHCIQEFSNDYGSFFILILQ